MTNLYRLSSGRYSGASGKGAALRGGRWNPVGMEAIYAAATPSLATLEILVHFSVLPRDFILSEIQIPADVKIELLPDDKLPPDWDALSPVAATQQFGRRWAEELRTAVLCVPSSILPIERNYVINPRHFDFPRITFLPSTPFRFDPRLK